MHNYVAIAVSPTNQPAMKLLKLESKSWRNLDIVLYVWREAILEGSANQAGTDLVRVFITQIFVVIQPQALETTKALQPDT